MAAPPACTSRPPDVPLLAPSTLVCALPAALVLSFNPFELQTPASSPLCIHPAAASLLTICHSSPSTLVCTRSGVSVRLAYPSYAACWRRITRGGVAACPTSYCGGRRFVWEGECFNCGRGSHKCEGRARGLLRREWWHARSLVGEAAGVSGGEGRCYPSARCSSVKRGGRPMEREQGHARSLVGEAAGRKGRKRLGA